MLILTIVVICLILGLLIFVAVMENELYSPKSIPETEQELHVRQLKMRISDAEFRFKKEIGEL